MSYKTVKGHGIVIYPESAPPNWQEIITNIGIPFAWALHDKDTKDGKPVKPHIHLYFFKPLSKKLQTFVLKSLGIQYIEPVHDLYGMYHYLWHDTPNSKNKYQYDKSIVKTSDNFYEEDYPKTIEKADIQKLIYKIIIEYGFTEITQLLNLFMDDEVDFDGISSKELRQYVFDKSFPIQGIFSSIRAQKGDRRGI